MILIQQQYMVNNKFIIKMKGIKNKMSRNLRVSILSVLLIISVFSLTACKKEAKRPEGWGDAVGSIEESISSAITETTIVASTEDQFAITEDVIENSKVTSKLSDKEKEELKSLQEQYKSDDTFSKDSFKNIILSDDFNSLTQEEKESLC